MTKAELVKAVAEKAGVSKAEAEKVWGAVFEVVAEDLKKEGKVAVPGFGTFKVTERAARKGINPATKAVIDIPASKGVGFKAAPSLKEEVK